MAGFGKIFDLGLLVIFCVEVSSHPKPFDVMDVTADKTDSDSPSAIDTFSDGLADSPDFGTSRAIYTSESPADSDSDIADGTHSDISDGTHTPDATPASADTRTTSTTHTFADKYTYDDTLVTTDEPVDQKDSSDDSDAAVPVIEDSDDDVRKVLIEDLKKRILRGLRLDNAPTETLNESEFSNDSINQVLHQEKEVTRSDEKENIIVHASNKDLLCRRSSSSDCRRLEFNIASDLDSVISAHAWFHKTRMSDRLVVRAYSSSEDEMLVKLKEVQNKTADESSGWTSIELPKTFTFESSGDRLVGILEIEGATFETENEHAPLMVVTRHTGSQEEKEEKAEKRDKRSIRTESCTITDFNVTVEEIGWQDWVHEPRSFNIRMCRGQCNSEYSLSPTKWATTYQQILNSYYKLNKNYPRPKCNFWGRRCRASSYRPLRIVYKPKKKDEGQQNQAQQDCQVQQGQEHCQEELHDQVLKDVIIESCRCM